jgi:hypothetical protein
MTIKLIQHNSSAYEQTISLRDEILRKPLGMKYDKVFIIFFLLLFNISFTKGQNFVNVDLQDGFRNDTVSLYINDTEIFENQILTSSRFTGEVGFSILFTMKSKLDYFITQSYPFDRKFPSGTALYKRANVLTGPDFLDLDDRENTHIWHFKVVMNQDTLTKSIDISRHKYIGIDRFDEKLEKGLFIVKSKIPFYYD